MPYRKYLVASIIFMIITTAITLIYPVLLQKTIDDVMLGGEFHLITLLLAGYFTLMVIKGIAQYIQQYTGEMFGIYTMYRLRDRLYEKLQFLPFRYYDNAKTGDIMSRLTADVQGVRHFLAMGITEVIRLILFIGISIIIMLSYSISLTIVTVLALPFLLVVVNKFDKARASRIPGSPALLWEIKYKGSGKCERNPDGQGFSERRF